MSNPIETLEYFQGSNLLLGVGWIVERERERVLLDTEVHIQITGVTTNNYPLHLIIIPKPVLQMIEFHEVIILNSMKHKI